MTAQKAIDFIENEVQIDVRFCFDEKVNKTIEAFKLAKSALKKQIPKKVIPFKRMAHDFQNDFCKHSGNYCEHIKTFNHEYQYTDYKCPCCDKRVSDGTPKYCDSCGQALDWSSEE